MKKFEKSKQKESTKMDILDRIESGEKPLIYDALRSDNPFICLRAIGGAAQNHVDDADALAIIKKLRNDPRWDFGIRVSDAATAAWHILIGEEYTGSNELVQCLIETNFCSKQPD